MPPEPQPMPVDNLPTPTIVDQPTVVNLDGEPALQTLNSSFETLAELNQKKTHLETIIASKQQELEEVSIKIALFNNK